METTSLIVLLLAGASVAIFHAILPDHWMPIALVARGQRWSTGRTTRVALWTGVGHVLGSIALGAVVIALGYGLKGILRLEGPIVGIVLVLTGVGLFLWSLRHPVHSHPNPHGAESDHTHEHAQGTRRGTTTATITHTVRPITPILTLRMRTTTTITTTIPAIGAPGSFRLASPPHPIRPSSPCSSPRLP